jgi:hypothetical protein
MMMTQMIVAKIERKDADKNGINLIIERREQ